MRLRISHPLLLVTCLLVGLAGSPVHQAPRAMAAAAKAPAPGITFTTGVADNRFTVGQPIAITMSLSNPVPVARGFTRSETLVDYYGNVTALLTDTITLAPNQTLTQIVQPPIQGSGYFELHVTLTDQTTNTQTGGFIPFSVLRPQTRGLDPNSAFGVNGSLTQAYGNNPQA